MLARNFLLASLFSFQGTDSNLFQGQIEMLTRLSKHFNPNLKRSGGDKRNRTAGLLLARQALSQLSYTPTSRKIQVVGPSGLEPPTSRLSVVRSSQLSYGPVQGAIRFSFAWPASAQPPRYTLNICHRHMFLTRVPSKLNNVKAIRSRKLTLGRYNRKLLPLKSP